MQYHIFSQQSTLYVTALVCEMRVVAAAGLPNSWPSWLWIRQLSYPLLSVWPFLDAQKFFVFFTFLFRVPISLLKKTKLVKGDLLNASDSQENFFLNRCVMKHYAISNGHIGTAYREIQEIGAPRWHRLYLQTLPGLPGSRINICSRSWNCLSFDVFLDPGNPAKVSNQAVQRDPTCCSQTLENKLFIFCLLWIDKARAKDKRYK